MSIKEILKDSIWISNPIAFQVLGVCSALAVTIHLENGIVMGIALTLVLSGSNVLLSLIINLVPHRVRIIVELAVISAFVFIVDQLLKSYYYDMSKTLSVFVGLIITNCIVMGRAEAFALANGPWISLWDGIGNGLGYASVLIIIGGIREILGSGTILNIQIIPECMYQLGYVNNGFMVLPPAAFVLLGLLIWVLKSLGGSQGKE